MLDHGSFGGQNDAPSVTVIVEEAVPLARTEGELATTVDVVASVNDDAISKAAEVAEVKPVALATRV